MGFGANKRDLIPGFFAVCFTVFFVYLIFLSFEIGVKIHDVMRWYSVSLSILAPLPFFLFPFFSLIILIFQYLRKMGWEK
jgi:hypothetical protein